MEELTFIEKNSSAWRKVDAYLEQKIADAQRKLEGPLSEKATDELRGRIRAFRVLKSFGDDVPIGEQPLPE